jgi:hypothetical protein
MTRNTGKASFGSQRRNSLRGESKTNFLMQSSFLGDSMKEDEHEQGLKLGLAIGCFGGFLVGFFGCLATLIKMGVVQ